ncbi:beta-galactosidase-1-like protein 2, partial [Dama dama]|uniref:beta-galactosidase-1-like protein 2 n=1 Tax=Dama dama TaxID=30532 RepID=UPI002A35FBD1
LLRPSHISERLVGLQVRGSDFTLGNTPFLILSGTIHYFRVPRDYWKDSLLKLKACGFNTVTTHVPWNLHEPRRGQFHYSGNLDLMAFISLASEVDLWVILCVGPYIGSDLDLGGLPSWLLKDSHMKLRTTYKGFTTAVNHYFDDLIPRIRGFQFHEEGSIIAVQMENEYGSYNLDKGYMPYIKNALLNRGIKTMLLTADTGQGLLKGHTPTVFATLHMKSIRKDTYERLSSVQGPGPVMMMVYTARSLDGWGTSRNTLDLHILMHEAREMLQLRFSLNFYMFHGGTNFGFMGGAAFRGHRLPMVTSYGKYQWVPRVCLQLPLLCAVNQPQVSTLQVGTQCCLSSQCEMHLPTSHGPTHGPVSVETRLSAHPASLPAWMPAQPFYASAPLILLWLGSSEILSSRAETAGPGEAEVLAASISGTAGRTGQASGCRRTPSPQSLPLWTLRGAGQAGWGQQRALQPWTGLGKEPASCLWFAEVPSFRQRDCKPKDTYAPLAAGHFISLWDTLIHQDDVSALRMDSGAPTWFPLPSLQQPVRSMGPLSMEQLSVNQGNGQSTGYILYETVITGGGVLNSNGHVKDRGQVFLDDKYIGVLDDTHQRLILHNDHYKEFLTLRILVENQGRLASGTSMNQERKGLTGNIYLNSSPLRKFKIYSLEMQNKFIQRKLPNIWKPSFLHAEGPAFFLALLRVGSQPKDTFMSLRGWTKGVVFINGQNLGRYWNLGPQETLYLPGPWLKPGLNEIIVFEEFKSTLLIYFSNVSQLACRLPRRLRKLPRSRSRCTCPSTSPASLSEVLTATSAVFPAAVALGPFLAVTGVLRAMADSLSLLLSVLSAMADSLPLLLRGTETDVNRAMAELSRLRALSTCQSPRPTQSPGPL